MPNEHITRGNPPIRPRTVGSSPQRGDYPPRRPPKKGRRNRGRFLLLLFLLVVLGTVLFFLFRSCGSSGGNAPSASNPSVAPSVSPDGSSSGSPAATPSPDPSVSMPAGKAPEGELEKGDTMMKVGGTAYEYYYFDKDTTNRYITAVCDAGTALEGTATLFNLVAPTSLDVLLPESYLLENGIDSQDQKKALYYISSSINGLAPSVKTVSLFDALKLHSDEEIYFRTDRHWTQLGAYYAYEEFCHAKGISPVALDQFDTETYPGFLGSFYQAWPNSEMENSPDDVMVYRSRANTSLYVLQDNGEELNGWPVIQDGSGYDAGNKYMIFSGADQPYEEITNSDLEDGSACLVIKDSFGCPFLPFLANHYQTVYAVDPQKYSGNVVQLAKDKGVSDVIILNDIAFTSNSTQVDALASFF